MLRKKSLFNYSLVAKLCAPQVIGISTPFISKYKTYFVSLGQNFDQQLLY